MARRPWCRGRDARMGAQRRGPHVPRAGQGRLHRGVPGYPRPRPQNRVVDRDGDDLTELDVYVGVSSGGFVAAALANGISPTQMYRLFIDDGADAALAPALFLRPAFGEFARRALSVPRLFAGAVLDFLRQPFR